MNLQDLAAQATLLIYRLAGYALLTWTDDAAILAMMFT